ncbi:MAG: TlpA family protein disulfide reductase, partial [Luteibaculum sp.]
KNDLIFNDNKEALSFSDEFIDISILDIENPNLFSVFRLSRPDSTIREQAQDAILQYITKGKEFADFYFNQRRNIRVSDVVYKEDSIRIGIMDFNVNGKYNDLGSDRIVIGNYAGKISGTEKASGAVILDSSTYFQSANYAFEVVQVAENGTSISFKPTFSTNADKRIEVGDSIKNYPFELLSGKKTSMHDFLDGNRYLYLHFWATWCAGCHQEMEDLHRLDSTNRNVVRIVSLNYNENITKIKSFTDQYKISWINGLSTTEINEALSVVGLPRNILINPSGKIIDMDSHPSDLLKQIDEF